MRGILIGAQIVGGRPHIHDLVGDGRGQFGELIGAELVRAELDQAVEPEHDLVGVLELVPLKSGDRTAGPTPGPAFRVQTGSGARCPRRALGLAR